MQQGMNGWSQANQGYQTLAQTACEVAPTNPIPGAIQSLGDNINELDALLDSLRNRLHMVLHPSAPQPVGNDEKCKSVMSPLVDEMYVWRLRVQMLSERVRDMLDRLET